MDFSWLPGIPTLLIVVVLGFIIVKTVVKTIIKVLLLIVLVVAALFFWNASQGKIQQMLGTGTVVSYQHS